MLLDGGDPLLESVAGQLGHHAREPAHVGGESVQIRVSFPDLAQPVDVIGSQPVGAGHDPGGDLADGWWLRSGTWRVSSAVAEPA